MKERFGEICRKLMLDIQHGELQVFSPIDSSELVRIKSFSADEVTKLVSNLQTDEWAALTLAERAEYLQKFADLVEQNAEILAEIITLDAGKTPAEAAGEVGNFSTVIRNNCDAALAKKLDNLGDMTREKRLHPIGVVGLITSFNFPLAVAGWTIAPAMLVGNSVLWKPSEKTPLIAIAIEKLFNQVIPLNALKVANGAAETGRAVVENSQMTSATGSVGMAQAILQNYAGVAPPILEAGGNNAVIVSRHNSAENRQFALESILKSFLAGAGQKCTNTRRLFVHAEIYDEFVDGMKSKLQEFVNSGNIKSPLQGESSEYGYSALIDEQSYEFFQKTIATAKEQGGALSFGERLEMEGVYVQPALLEMPTQTEIMQHECFAPLLFVVKYTDFSKACEQVNVPENAGLVNGLYTQSQAEVDEFVRSNGAGHTVINAPNGTGTPAHGMGFGGNKLSGMGEILSGEDQLCPFAISANRIAINSSVKLA